MTHQKLYVVDGINVKAFNHEVNRRLRDGWHIQSTALWYDAEFNQPHYVAYLVNEVEVGDAKIEEQHKKNAVLPYDWE